MLSPERQSAQTSEIKNVGETLMALKNFKCNHVMQLHFKGLSVKAIQSSSRWKDL